MSRPFWSVIIPVYRPYHYLEQCLASVYRQHLDLNKDMQVLIQDNGDNYQWLKSSVNNNFLQYLDYQKNPRDLGCYGSVNAAIRRAQGEFVHIICDDDWVLKGFHQAVEAEEGLCPSVGAFNTHYSNYDQNTRWTSSPPPFRDGPGLITDWLREVLTRGNPLQVCAVAIRRSVFDDIGYFREDLPYAADYEMWARICSKYDWWYIPQDLARYRQHDAAGYNAMLRDGSARKEMEVVKALAKEYRDQRMVAS